MPVQDLSSPRGEHLAQRPDLDGLRVVGGVVDQIVEEPPGGAHQDWDAAARRLDNALREALASLEGLSEDELVDDRYRRFRSLGAVRA